MSRARHPESFGLIYRQIAERVGGDMQTYRVPAAGPMPDAPDPKTGTLVPGLRRLYRLRAHWYGYVTALRRESAEPAYAALLPFAKRVTCTILVSECALVFSHAEVAEHSVTLGTGEFSAPPLEAGAGDAAIAAEWQQLAEALGESDVPGSVAK